MGKVKETEPLSASTGSAEERGSKPSELDFFANFSRHVEGRPDAPALQLIHDRGKESFSYRQVALEVGKVGRFLQRSGVKPGDPVGLLMENNPRWGMAFLAGMSAGAVLVPLDGLHDAETLAGLIGHAECRFLIVSSKFLPKLREIQSSLSEPLPVLAVGDRSSEHPSWGGVLEEETAPETLPLVRQTLDEPFLILYTSGTTGNPKGVVLSSRNVFRNVVELLKVVRNSPEDHLLSVLPLYHVLALIINFITPLYLGGRTTFLEILEAPRILQAFREEGITIFVCVPQFYYLVHRRILQEVEKQSFLRRFLFRRLLKVSRFCNTRLGWNPGRYFFRPIHARFGPQFRIFGVGGARFDPEIAQSFRDLGFTIVQAYGMTETAALITVTPPTGAGLGTVGKPLPHTEVRILDPDKNGIGEVLARGESVMQGYLKNPEATCEILKDGWLHTGDLGYQDRNGFFQITGRKKEVIVLSSGKNIFPEEIEHHYQKHCPYIKEMCVVGVPDSDSPNLQEKLHGVIVPDFDQLKKEGIVNAADMIRYMMETLSQALPPHKRVRSFEIRHDPLPRTTTRKIKRFELEKEFGQELRKTGDSRFSEATRPEGRVEETVFEMIKKAKSPAILNREMNLEIDLGFDSLQRVELLATLEEAFGIEIPDEEGGRIFTVQDLVKTLEEELSGKGTVAQDVRRSWGEILNEPLRSAEEERVRQILVRKPFGEHLVWVTALTVRLLSRILFRTRVTGREHLPREYPYLICPNHLSFLDVFLIASEVSYPVSRRIFYLAYADYFEGPVLRFLGRLLRVVPVDSDRHLKQALRLAAEGLRRDLVLCVFPEGERSIDGTLKDFRKGPAILASELKVPVVPVGIVGTYEIWPRGSTKIRLHPVRIRFGKPLQPAGAPGDYESFNQDLFKAVQRLVEE